MSSTPPWKRSVAFLAPSPMSSEAPTRNSETPIVSTDANVRVTLRLRLLPVSRTT